MGLVASEPVLVFGGRVVVVFSASFECRDAAIQMLVVPVAELICAAEEGEAGSEQVRLERGGPDALGGRRRSPRRTRVQPSVNQ